MWYTPQHSLSFALGLIAILAASRVRRQTSAGGFLLTGVALGLSVATNPFLGASFCVVYGAAIAYDVLAGRLERRALVQQALTVIPVLLALGWTFANGMSAGAGSAVSFGWLYDARHAPVVTLVLSLGGLLLPALVGFWPWRGVPWRPALPAAIGMVVGLGLMYFVTLTDRSWVGFRAGNILQVLLPMLVARGFAGLSQTGHRTVAVVVFAAALVAGAPTTAIDAYNAQDTSNRMMGPGFLWTMPITSSQQQGFAWIRQATSPDAIVQADPVVRGRQNWSVIPTFAARRMAAGEPISLLPDPEYARRAERVHAIVTALPLDQAHRDARALGIDYLWLDQDDRRPTPADLTARFAERPDLFEPVFEQGEVAIYRVH